MANNEKRITSIYTIGQGVNAAVDVSVISTHQSGAHAVFDAIISFNGRTVSIYQRNSFDQYIRQAVYSVITLDRLGLIVEGLIDITNLVLYDAEKADRLYENDPVVSCGTDVNVITIERLNRGKMLGRIDYVGGFTTTRNVLCGCHYSKQDTKVLVDTL